MEFEGAMRAEHCSKAGFDTEFTTSNYSITTTPQREWRFVVDMDTAGADMRHNRRVLNLEELSQLDTAKTAKLFRVELIAVTLYTGPMVHRPYFSFCLDCREILVPRPAQAYRAVFSQFAVYNTILRRWPTARYEAFHAGGNLFATTIHVLVSAIQKIACAMKLPEGLILYRGLGGVRLPECFHKADESGSRGFAEWGFMSTTADKQVAITYAGLDEHRPLPTVFEMRVGAVDRGACIQEFSQYPAEVE